MADLTPEQQQAQDRMRQWMERHQQQTPDFPGPFGGMLEIGSTVQALMAAAGAGQFAIAPDTGQKIIEQLTEVQDQARNMIFEAQQAAADPRFGGGYAEQVSKFVQQVAAGASGSAEEVLTKFQEELGQLKEAVAKSIDNYRATDVSSASELTSARGQP